ncbi:unnamed protein product, partial [Rotaria sp. Silwood2]
MAQQTIILKTLDAFKNDSIGSTDRQVPPTPLSNDSGSSLLSPISFKLPRKKRHQTRLYRPRVVRQLA